MNFLIYLLKMVIFHRKVLDSCHAKAQAQAIVWSLEMQGVIMDDASMVLDISECVHLGHKTIS
jgi:hypothetical protein